MLPSILNSFLLGDEVIGACSSLIMGWPTIAVPVGFGPLSPLYTRITFFPKITLIICEILEKRYVLVGLRRKFKKKLV